MSDFTIKLLHCNFLSEFYIAISYPNCIKYSAHERNTLFCDGVPWKLLKTIFLKIIFSVSWGEGEGDLGFENSFEHSRKQTGLVPGAWS